MVFCSLDVHRFLLTVACSLELNFCLFGLIFFALCDFFLYVGFELMSVLYVLHLQKYVLLVYMLLFCSHVIVMHMKRISPYLSNCKF